jgi:hypothetical protein
LLLLFAGRVSLAGVSSSQGSWHCAMTTWRCGGVIVWRHCDDMVVHGGTWWYMVALRQIQALLVF